MANLDQYIEKKGIKNILSVVTIYYVIGAIIFNIYLWSLGIFEYNMVQMRYLFVSLTFTVISFIPCALYIFIRKLIHNKKNIQESEEQGKRFWKKFEHIVILLLIPWGLVYALYVLPLIPSGLGGTKPIAARLIGKVNDVKEINEMIAHETGVPVDKLPFEKLTDKSDLAVGANVYILDRDPVRIILLLTKDLYLRSTSRVAAQLVDAGQNLKVLNTDATKNFKIKPLIVNGSKVVSVSTTLYEPSDMLTSDDIAIAASAMAANWNNQQKKAEISQVLAAKDPDVATKVLQVVGEQVQKNQENKENNLQTSNNTEDISDTTQENLTTVDTLSEQLSGVIDTNFLDFRSHIFSVASNLCSLEKKDQKDPTATLALVQSISDTLQKKYPNAFDKLAIRDNYLEMGQSETEFSCNIMQIFQGAQDALAIVTRLNDKKPNIGPKFQDVIKGAQSLYAKSSQNNTPGDRKYFSQVITNYFAQQARQRADAWSDTKYLYDGKQDENYFAHIGIVLQDSTSWESFAALLQRFEGQWIQIQKSRGIDTSPPIPHSDTGDTLSTIPDDNSSSSSDNGTTDQTSGSGTTVP